MTRSFNWLLSLAISICILSLLFGIHPEVCGNPLSFTKDIAGGNVGTANPTIISSSDVYPTCYVMFFWGTAEIDGLSVAPGDRIDAFAPDVVVNDGCIGTFTVWYPGYYGALAVYGDDRTTTEKDGAAEGDPITFTITSAESGKTYVAYTSINPTFRNFSFQRVDLSTQ
jgi:hypothetical protein